jgi:hypothetical protein
VIDDDNAIADPHDHSHVMLDDENRGAGFADFVQRHNVPCSFGFKPAMTSSRSRSLGGFPRQAFQPFSVGVVRLLAG